MSRYKRYERYKDSGVEWIGEIPEHWEINKLKRLSNIITGNTPPKSEEENYDDEGIPWVKPDNIQDDGTISETKERLSVIGLQKARLIPKSSAIVCCIGTVGKVGFTQEDCTTNQQINSIIFERPSIWNNKYGFYCLYSSKNEHEKYSNKVVVSILNKTQQGNILMPVPSLKEQKAIASFLDQKTAEIDGLVADKEKLIELLREKRQAIITEAVTKGLNPNVRMKDSGIKWIGEIPEHWDIRRIKYLANVRNIKASDSDNDKTYVGLENIEPKTGKLLINNNDEQQIIGETANIFKKGDVLFGKLRPYLAKCIVANFNGRCTSELLVLRTTSNILPEYLYFFMLSPIFIDVVNSSTYGAKMPRASWDFIGNLKIPLPNIKEQEEIVEYLIKLTNKIDDLISDISTQIQKLKEYRQSLISEAVTGKIDVREFADKAEVI
ncbi:MAG: type restriction enzyme subunit [Thermoanaerobacterium sp.]|nr:type restriction enzyme subunit [Thermoanaerobacterium sp.]